MPPDALSRRRSSVLPDLLRLGRHTVAESLRKQAEDKGHVLAVDATCGNGHDTLFLANLLGGCRELRTWTVLGFDLQQQALDNTAALLADAGMAANMANGSVRLLRQGHETLESVLSGLSDGSVPPSDSPRLGAVVYNLGFLPGSDKRVRTVPETTLASLDASARFLAGGGVIAVHAYGGHGGGPEEMAEVERWFQGLPFTHWQAARYAICNKTKNPEALFLAVKRVLQV